MCEQLAEGAEFTKLRKVNIRNSFAILSYVFCVSANKLLYEKFTKEFRKAYDRLESYEEFTKSLRNFVTLS